MRMCGDPRVDDLACTIGGNDSLDAELGDAFLAAWLADRRARAGTPEKRPGSGRVPGAPFVLADPAGAGAEDGVASPLERLARDEPDELVSPPTHVPSLRRPKRNAGQLLPAVRRTLGDHG